MELFEQMRREYEHGMGTVAGVARKFGVHRRMVRQALASAIPPGRKLAERDGPQIGPVQEFIGAVLEADRQAPRDRKLEEARRQRQLRRQQAA